MKLRQKLNGICSGHDQIGNKAAASQGARVRCQSDCRGIGAHLVTPRAEQQEKTAPHRIVVFDEEYSRRLNLGRVFHGACLSRETNSTIDPTTAGERLARYVNALQQGRATGGEGALQHVGDSVRAKALHDAGARDLDIHEGDPGSLGNAFQVMAAGHQFEHLALR